MYTVHEHIYQIKLIKLNIEYCISHQFVSVNRVEYLTKTVANYWKSRGKPDEEFKRKNRIKKKQYLSHVWEACEMCQARNGSGGGRGITKSKPYFVNIDELLVLVRILMWGSVRCILIVDNLIKIPTGRYPVPPGLLHLQSLFFPLHSMTDREIFIADLSPTSSTHKYPL